VPALRAIIKFTDLRTSYRLKRPDLPRRCFRRLVGGMAARLFPARIDLPERRRQHYGQLITTAQGMTSGAGRRAKIG
jgi:hypothetical protein